MTVESDCFALCDVVRIRATGGMLRRNQGQGDDVSRQGQSGRTRAMELRGVRTPAQLRQLLAAGLVTADHRPHLAYRHAPTHPYHRSSGTVAAARQTGRAGRATTYGRSQDGAAGEPDLWRLLRGERTAEARG